MKHLIGGFALGMLFAVYHHEKNMKGGKDLALWFASCCIPGVLCALASWGLLP